MAAASVQVQHEDKCRFHPHGLRWEEGTTGFEGEGEAVINALGDVGETFGGAHKPGASWHAIGPMPMGAFGEALIAGGQGVDRES